MEKMDSKKAVAIAKDVLKRLAMRKLKVEGGTYCFGEIPKGVTIPEQGDAKRHIGKLEKTCHVCAVGAAFLSHIRLHDRVDLNEFNIGRNANIDRDKMAASLDEIFGSENLLRIESAFEGGSIDDFVDYDECYTDEQYDAHYRMRTQSECGTPERLEAVMRNVVANKGVFTLNAKAFKAKRKAKAKAGA